ncbi:MAG: IS1380 family transposase [Dermatophilaceae bacterium]
MKLSHGWDRGVAAFDDVNLVSCAGLVPVLELAEQTGLSELLDEHVAFTSELVRSGAANPTPKLTSIIGGLLAGADSIGDLDVIRAGGTHRLFTAVYAPTTLGTLLREFTGGHVRQLQAVGSRHLLALAARTTVLEGIGERAFVDIDSLLRPVYGHAKQGASFGHTKIAGKQVLRRGLSPLATTISTPRVAPVVAGIRLRAGRAGSGRGAASMVTEAVNVAKAAGAKDILVRGDAAYGSSAVIRAALRAKVAFSLVLTRNPSLNRAIDSIPADAWVPVQYPGAVTDPDTGALISDAEVAEVAYTAFADTPQAVTARLVVRRVRDRNIGPEDEMFPVWRYHPFFTNSTEPVAEADITHRRHAIIETLFADLIDGPLAHMPSGSFWANSAWTVLAAITHNLLRAAGTLAGTTMGVARGATLRRHLVNVPARFTRPQGRPTLHLPAHWPHATAWNRLWDNIFACDATVQVAA